MVASGPIQWAWSGAVTDSSAVVKAKVAADAGAPHLVIAKHDLSPDAVSPSGVATFRVQGLSPETRFEYQVLVGAAASMTGHFETFAPSLEPLSFRFVFGSCAKTGSNHHVFQSMQALEPRFTLHMGDFHYENITHNDPEEYRHAFDKVLASARQSSLYRSAPIVYMWDDHDYGPNDADGTSPGKPAALATYDEYVPHYPLERVEGQLSDLRQSFSVGRVRFILTDERSHRAPDDLPDGPSKTMLGEDQREWLLQEIEAARGRYPLVVWVSTVPWITEPGSEHGWGRYDWERRYIANRIHDAGMSHRLLMLSGDAHMVAIDDGTNSNFANDATPGERGFPVMHAAPFDRYARHKGGPYSHGKAGRRILFGLIPIQQFGLAEIDDDGESLRVTLSGRDEDGKPLKGMGLILRCDKEGCEPSGELRSDAR